MNANEINQSINQSPSKARDLKLLVVRSIVLVPISYTMKTSRLTHSKLFSINKQTNKVCTKDIDIIWNNKKKNENPIQ